MKKYLLLFKLFGILSLIWGGLVWMEKLPRAGSMPKGWEESILFTIGAAFSLIGWWEELLDKLADLTRKTPRFLIAPLRLTKQPIGREQDRRRLNRRLRREQMLNLTGPGGLGKTTLLQYFIERYQHRFDNVIYLFTGATFSDRSDHSDRNAEQFLRAFTGVGSELVVRLQLVFEPQATDIERFNLVIGRMAELPGRSLLVIDNCFDLPSKHIEQLSRLAGWRILITSRTRIANLPEFELFHLDPADALRLFRRIFEIQGDNNRLSDLLRRYDYHTKTVELLAHYARDRHWNVTDMENELRKKHLLELPDYTLTSFDGRSIGLAGHLLATFALDLSEDAQNLMRHFSLLPPKGANIQPELLSEEKLAYLLGCDDDAVRVGLHNTLEALIRLSWLERVDSGIFIHPVIQEVAYYELKPSIEQCRTLVQRVSAMLNIDQSKDNPVDKFPLLVFGETLMEGIGESPDADYSVLMGKMAWILEDLGQYEKARDLLETALASDLKNFGPEHPNVARSQSNLANVYSALGQYEKARDLLEAALASAEKNFGPEHPNVAVSQSNLALAYRNLGQYEKACDLLEASLESDLKNFDPEHPNVAVRQSNLANVYSDLGQYEKACDLLESALASAEKNFDPEHPNVAVRQSNLALVYSNLGQYEKARDLLESALTSDLKNFGPEHPNVAVRQSNLATVYRNLDQYEKARDLLEAALALDLKNFGPEHPNVAVSQSNLANVYADLGQYEKARDLLESALASDLKNFGPEHPNVARSQSNLANVYYALGQYEKARDLLESALASDLKNFGPEHPTVAVSQLNLGAVFSATGDKAKAKELFGLAYKLFKQQLGEQHPNTQKAKKWLDSVDEA